MEVCQTSSLLMLTLACFQKSCRHFPAGEGAFPKSVPETCGIVQEKFGFLCTGMFWGSVFQGWAVECSVHVWDNICRCQSCQCFYMKISCLILFQEPQNSDNYCLQNIAEGFEKHVNVRFCSFMTCSGIYLFPLTVFLTLLAVRLWMLTASWFLVVGWAAVLPLFGVVIFTVLPVEVLHTSEIWGLVCRL